MGWMSELLARKYDEAQDAEAAERERQRMLVWRPGPPTKDDRRSRRIGILVVHFGSGAGAYMAIGQPCDECIAPATHYAFIVREGGGYGRRTCAAHAGPRAGPLPSLPPEVRRQLEAAGCLPEDA